MWGSTTPNTASQCTWSNAPFNNRANDYDSNYFNNHKSEWLDDNNNLKPKYDAASHIMGGDWRMPTKAECQELIDNTEYKWFDDFNSSGVSGGKFTSKINGNSIFIPAAGCYDEGLVTDVGEESFVRSSSLMTSNYDNALSLVISWEECFTGGNLRCKGLPVRGVFK